MGRWLMLPAALSAAPVAQGPMPLSLVDEPVVELLQVETYIYGYGDEGGSVVGRAIASSREANAKLREGAHLFL
eukprot:scaffold1860_cov403-Prasinococcus_capsulatus_cf.AAC.8